MKEMMEMTDEELKGIGKVMQIVCIAGIIIKEIDERKRLGKKVF